MSYRGRPSKGCDSCRARKVKCDEAKPTCNRCLRSGHDCKYRDPADLLFRNQTASAAQKAEDSWRQRAKSSQRPPGDSSKQPSAASSSNSHSSSAASPPRAFDYEALQDFNNLSLTSSGIQPDLRQLAYDRFLYDFIIDDLSGEDATGPGSDSFMSFVPSLYEISEEGSCARTIIEANCYANFYSRCNAPKARVLAEELVGKGLKMLQVRIADKQLAPTDETLGCVHMMGLYENLTSPVRDGGFIAHKDGANALLKLRSVEQYFSNPISAKLYEAASAQSLVGNLNMAMEPNDSLHKVVAARQANPGLYSNTGIYMINLVHDEATLHAKWHRFKRNNNPPVSRQALQELLRSALDLDAEYQAWEASVPPGWRARHCRNTPELRATFQSKWANVVLGSEGAPEELSQYVSLKRSWVWMFFRASRTYLLRDTIEMLNWALRLPEPDLLDISEPSSDINTATALDTISLRIHHAFATSHLVDTVEKTCSTVLAHFTIPVAGKSFEDVPGLRGYTCFWALGVLDGLFRMGILPDSGSSAARTSNLDDWPPVIDPSIMQAQPQPQMYHQHHQYPSPAMFRFPHEALNPLYHDPETTIPDPNDFPKLDPIPLISVGAPPRAPATSSSRAHIPSVPPTPPTGSGSVKLFQDLEETHPWDYTPENLAPLGVQFAAPPAIDVARRKAWLHRIIYYCATELGIRKGLALIVMDGYLEKTKMEVETMLGK